MILLSDRMRVAQKFYAWCKTAPDGRALTVPENFLIFLAVTEEGRAALKELNVLAKVVVHEGFELCGSGTLEFRRADGSKVR